MRDSSAATSTFMPEVTTAWNSSWMGDMSTLPPCSPSIALTMDSSSCPVVSEQYLDVLTTAHTKCCCAASRLRLGAMVISAGCPTAASFSCTRFA